MNLKVLRNFFFQYGLFLCLIITILSGTLYFSLKKSYFINLLNKEDYATKLSSSILEEMNNCLHSSGFDESILKEIFSVSDIESVLIQKIDALDNQTNPVVDISFIKENLQNNINNYLKEKNLTASTDDLNRFIDQITSVYESELNLYNYSDLVINAFQKVKKYNLILFPITICITLLFLSLNVIFVKKDSLNVCLFASSLFLFFITYYITSKIDIEHIYLFHATFTEFLKTYILNFLKVLRYCSLILLLLFVILFTISLKRQEK